MSREAQIRAAGASYRSSLAGNYRDHGEHVGLAVCRRYAWETGDMMAEVHGARLASEVLFGVADTIATRAALPKLDGLQLADPPVAPAAGGEVAEEEFREALRTLRAATDQVSKPASIPNWVSWSIGLAAGLLIGWSAHA